MSAKCKYHFSTLQKNVATLQKVKTHFRIQTVSLELQENEMLFVHVATTNWRTPLLETLLLLLYNLNGSQKIFAIPTEFARQLRTHCHYIFCDVAIQSTEFSVSTLVFELFPIINIHFCLRRRLGARLNSAFVHLHFENHVFFFFFQPYYLTKSIINRALMYCL